MYSKTSGIRSSLDAALCMYAPALVGSFIHSSPIIFIVTMATSDTSAKRKDGNPQGNSETKRQRFQEPDVVVVVGPEKEEFHCYRLLSSLASDFFDAMLSNRMSENETGQIVLSDMDPDVWRLVYTFIDPATVRTPKVTKDNVEVLVPWFHRFQMTNCLAESEAVIVAIIDKRRDAEGSDWNAHFEELLRFLSLSNTYKLESALEKARRRTASIRIIAKFGRMLSLFRK
jgi:hypothetical protein